MTARHDEPLYSIRVAARLVGLHVQTLRYYERSGLVSPQRSAGNVRYYSNGDVEHIRRIKSLVDELGVNLAGVEVIIRMGEQMAHMENAILALEAKVAELTCQRSLPAKTTFAQPDGSRVREKESQG
ncbi:MAG: MerR family transcriptional regulator [Dehalococcoidia bacterium]|nr:MerR family transcriptional regulator [Dehalococcoidia bacterium]